MSDGMLWFDAACPAPHRQVAHAAAALGCFPDPGRTDNHVAERLLEEAESSALGLRVNPAVNLTVSLGVIDEDYRKLNSKK